jgi:hypothetical protein
MTQTITKAQLISPPDGKVIETLTDTRTLATVVGVTLGNAGEKALFRAARDLFGVAATKDGAVVYYKAKPDGTSDTSEQHPQFRTNRNVARAVGVVGAVAAIEYTASAPAQYGALGAASIWFCHIVQDLIPQLR